jgi:hypothetical protein
MVPSSYGGNNLTSNIPFSPSGGEHFQSISMLNSDIERPSVPGYSVFPEANFQDSNAVLDTTSGKILVPESRSNEASDHPFLRFYNNDANEAPWNPQGLDNSQWSAQPRFFTANSKSVVRPGPGHYSGYRDIARSNPESHITGKQQPDSGYETHNASRTKSVVSNGEGMEAGDDNHSFIQGINDMQINQQMPGNSFYSGSTQTASVANYSTWNEQEQQQNQLPLVCGHPDCGDQTTFKNLSELKYVLLNLSRI